MIAYVLLKFSGDTSHIVMNDIFSRIINDSNPQKPIEYGNKETMAKSLF